MRTNPDLCEDVLETTDAFHWCISAGEQAVVERLIARGYTPLRAEILLSFVPLGLARAIIVRLPVSKPIRLPDRALVRDDNGNLFRVLLSVVPEFITARQMGEENFITGIIDRESFSDCCGSSVELILLNNLLNDGVEIAGSEISPPILLRLANVPGFEEWYRKLAS